MYTFRRKKQDFEDLRRKNEHATLLRIFHVQSAWYLKGKILDSSNTFTVNFISYTQIDSNYTWYTGARTICADVSIWVKNAVGTKQVSGLIAWHFAKNDATIGWCWKGWVNRNRTECQKISCRQKETTV